MDLLTPVNQLVGVGDKINSKFKRLGIVTVKDLLWHIPFRYIDAASVTPVSQLKIGEDCAVEVTIDSVQTYISPRKRIPVLAARVSDRSGQINIVWFNQLYLKRTLSVGSTKLFHGKVVWDFSTRQKTLSNPIILGKGGIIPVYHETAGLGSGTIRNIIAKLLSNQSLLNDPLPQEIINKFSYPDRETAFNSVHQPKSTDQISSGRERLALDELISIAIQFKSAYRNSGKAAKIPILISDIKELVTQAGFRLTSSQRKTAWQIVNDLNLTKPMKRLLMGDVGSGKTIVAAIASLIVAKAGYQTLWLAPTGVLANQHFASASKLFNKFKFKIGLFTGSIKNANLLSDDIIIGTHALLQPKYTFGNIGLVVIDEQHRFGVSQRSKLSELTDPVPHFLSMTATPIPRTLALTLYGGLDISVLDELPAKRKSIITKIIETSSINDAYSHIEREIKSGHQAFIITPLIDASDQNSLELFEEDKKSVIKEYEIISKNIFPQFKVGLLHGKMTSKEKSKVMAEFVDNKINILVSTSIVEVGIDIPNATVIMVENAETFGLAQLHQLRGRVGRSIYQSYCLLVSNIRTENIASRLEALVKYQSGFKLAEIDLQLRGPGSLTGLSQSGFPDLKVARLTDTIVLERARYSANWINDNLSQVEKELIVNAGETQHFE